MRNIKISNKKATNSKAYKNSFFGRHDALLASLLLGLITLAVYWQTLNHDFVGFDDPAYITENQHIKNGLTLKSITWSFTTMAAGNWHPLTWISHIFDVHVYGMNPKGHHLTNVIFHILNSLLLFLVLKRMTGALWKSAFIAALFALHPLHVESVAWAAERKDVLSAFFWILTLWGYVCYAHRQGVGRYMLVLLFFILGLMSKPMMVTLPFVLILMDYWPLKRFHLPQQSCGYLILEKVPLFVLSAISCFMTFIAQRGGGAVGSLTLYPLSVRIENAIVSYIAYIIKMVWPYDLAVLYPHPQTLPWWQVAGACLLLILISLIIFKAMRQRPYLAVGWLWYTGGLVPVIGIVQVGSQAMADRYTYIPLIGLFIIIAWGIPELTEKWRSKRKGLTLIATMTLLILTANTYLQIRHWADGITLFGHALHVTENNYFMHNNFGLALASQGRPKEAIKHYSESLRLAPMYDIAHCNLGIALISEGEFTAASTHFSEALMINPQYTDALNGLGIVHGNQGKPGKAIEHFSKALQIDPTHVYALHNLKAALEFQKEKKDSREQ